MTTQTVASETTSVSPTPSELPDHSGKIPLPPYDLFFPPPVEIGKVISARSSLRVGKRPLSGLARFGINLAIPAAVCAAMYFLAQFTMENSNDRWTVQALGVVIAVIAFPILLLWNRTPRCVCSYVGEQGVAILSARRRNSPTPDVNLLLFNSTAELQASQVRQHYNGIYTATKYGYYWKDFEGNVVFQLKGSYYAKKGKLPKPKSPYHLARMAELVWSQVLTARADQCLKEEGSIPFRVDKSRVVRVGPGFIEFHFGGEPVRVTKDEIAKVTLGGGTFSFQHKDAKWFSRQGKFTFQYGKMANAKMFLMALDKLMGYRWN